MDDRLGANAVYIVVSILKKVVYVLTQKIMYAGNGAYKIAVSILSSRHKNAGF